MSKPKIIDTTSKAYINKREQLGKARYNGAYYYSQEIVKNIIPSVKTDRNWITVNLNGIGCDHSIVFVHNNKKPENYNWLKDYKDLVFVCGVPETCEKVRHLGRVIYLPLNIDVADVEKYKTEKTLDTAYAGRKPKRMPGYVQGVNLPDVPCLEELPREELLTEMAKYKKIYAVGRTAVEAKALGCEVLPYDPRYPDPDVWKVLDNKDAAKMLQKELDKIDDIDDIDRSASTVKSGAKKPKSKTSTSKKTAGRKSTRKSTPKKASTSTEEKKNSKKTKNSRIK